MLLDGVILLETVFFTLSLLPRRLWSVLRKRLRPVAERELPPATQNAEVSDEFVLVALDQRSDGSVLDSWSTGLRTARSLATSRVIRVLTAPVVVTDLPHVARWAKEKGIETVDLVR